MMLAAGTSPTPFRHHSEATTLPPILSEPRAKRAPTSAVASERLAQPPPGPLPHLRALVAQTTFLMIPPRDDDWNNSAFF